MRLHQLLRESLSSLGLHAATSNSMETACSCNETPDSIGTMEELHLTRATRHVCGAAPCLGVADVAGSVIGHAGDVACAQTKTSAQRSREQSHTIRTEIKRADTLPHTHTATGECPRSRQGQPRQGQHAYGGVHARAPVLTSMCKRESTHPRRIPRRGAPWSRSLLRWDQGGAHRGRGQAASQSRTTRERWQCVPGRN